MDETKDSNGAILSDGDSVQLIKDLKVKGTSMNMKRGSVVKNIRLTSDPEEIECRDGKSTLVLKTCFLKKV
ncbi:MAG: alkylphosphonate utilization protein [Magnetospirillum sp.]|nr:alkylphosphonate utilization protein [Magnetospirillum sp.]